MRQRYIAIVDLSSSSQKCPLPYANWPTPPPTSRIARTRRFGGLVAGQGLRWAGTRAANTLRSDERADAATGRARRRHRARARQAARPDARRGDEGRPGPLDRRLHRDPGVRARGVQGHARRAARRRPAAAVQGDREAAARRARRARSSEAFADFEHEAFAAASIGQVHRATTADGRAVAVKIQYPGHRRGGRDRPAQRADCCSRWSSASRPGSTSRRWPQELRERIGDELDYEVEAQNHRAMARAWRGHPFVYVPPVDTGRSPPPRARHASCIEGRHFEAVKRSAKPSATATARSSSASSSARSSTCAAPPATRIPATTCCSTTAASASSTSA